MTEIEDRKHKLLMKAKTASVALRNKALADASALIDLANNLPDSADDPVEELLSKAVLDAETLLTLAAGEAKSLLAVASGLVDDRKNLILMKANIAAEQALESLAMASELVDAQKVSSLREADTAAKALRSKAAESAAALLALAHSHPSLKDGQAEKSLSKAVEEAKMLVEAASGVAVELIAVAAKTAEVLLEKEKRLEGVIPICMHCKKIRADDGWQQLERYIQENSDALFTHGICPGCIEKSKRG
jgi:hypothetical protein